MLKKITEENIYLLSLEKGVETIKDGISLAEMKEYLKNAGCDVSFTAYANYPIWFFENFFVQGVDVENDLHIRSYVFNKNPNYMRNYEVIKGNIKSHAYFDYLEYIELQESRATSSQAKNISWIAIGISAGLAIIQIWIELRK